MTKSLAILLLLRLNSLSVSSALAVQSSSSASGTANSEKNHTVQIKEDTSPTMGKAKPVPTKPQVNKSAKGRKMKSNNLRWALRGIATELFHNIFLRTITRVRTRLFVSKQQRLEMQDRRQFRQPPNNEIAVVTGATGGIGSQICHDLALRGYDVVVAARDAVRGKHLVDEIKGVLNTIPVKENEKSSGGGDGVPTISFVEYHADVPQSALDVASSIKDLEESTKSKMSILINNAGIMGKSKHLTMKVNLLGPAILTLALLPLMAKTASSDGEECKAPPTVINVGSSAHLRATHVINEEEFPPLGRSYIDSLPGDVDDDLSTYAQSKLALMQFSTLLRHWVKKSGTTVPIQIFDAHPGLVWTPLLRNHIGERAVGALTKTGLARLIYKSSTEGAQAIVSALDSAPTLSTDQVYFVNGQPGGYAASESTSIDASIQLWEHVLVPEVEGIVHVPEGFGKEG